MFRDAEIAGKRRRDPFAMLGDRVPPHNIEAEQGTLGSVILDGGILPEVAAELKPGDFYRDDHETLWKAVLRVYDAGTPVDTVTVHEAVKGEKAPHGQEWYELIAEVVNSVPHSANGVYFAKIVRQKAHRRRLIEVLSNQLVDAFDDTDRTPSELVASSQEAVCGLTDDASSTADVPLSQAAAEVLEILAMRSQGMLTGVRCGLRSVDFLLGGFHPGRFYLLAARPSMGKTALLLNIAELVAQGRDEAVLFFSLEMTRQELAERYLSGRARVDGYKFKYPKTMGDEQMGRVFTAARRDSNDSALRIDDDPAPTVAQIAMRARRCRQRHGLGLVVIDYLQLVEGPRQKGENRQEEIARISRRLRALAKELHVPIIAACQLNRQSESRDDRRPRMADLRESGQLEADAHGVLLLHRPEYYDPNDSPGTAELIIAKNRGGATGTVKLTFVKSETRFEEAPDARPVPGAGIDNTAF